MDETDEAEREEDHFVERNLRRKKKFSQKRVSVVTMSKAKKTRWKTSLSQMSLQLERTQQKVFQLENELSRKEKEIERLTAQLHHSLQNWQEISGDRRLSDKTPPRFVCKMVNVFVKFESRKAELEIESAVQKTELIHKVKELLCCTIADVKLMRFDKSLDQWSLVSSSKLYLKDGEDFKLKLCEDNDGPPDTGVKVENDICLVAKRSSVQRDIADELEWDNVGAWLPENRLWKGEGELIECLRVYFFDDEDDVLENLYYKYEQLTPNVVMKIINEHWNMNGVKNGQYVPKFQQVYKSMAEVRVQFRSAYGSWSKLGSAAESVPLDEPTVVLNFDHCKDDFDIEATILHQFGHVLGLGHMHQDSKYWEVITKFLHMDLMLENLNISRKQFDTQWSSSDWIGHQWIRMGSFDDSFTQKCNYDEDSIMHYQTKLSWLDPKFRIKDNLKQLKDITKDEYRALKKFHKQTNFICCRPSKDDKLKLAQAYRALSEKI